MENKGWLAENLTSVAALCYQVGVAGRGKREGGGVGEGRGAVIAEGGGGTYSTTRLIYLSSTPHC